MTRALPSVAPMNRLPWRNSVVPLAAGRPHDSRRRSKARESVTIHRDEWGVPHIYGPTDAATSFGLAYAQAEDFFWQIEDTYLQALGRYAEVVGPAGLELRRADAVVRGPQPFQGRLRKARRPISRRSARPTPPA